MAANADYLLRLLEVNELLSDIRVGLVVKDWQKVSWRAESAIGILSKLSGLAVAADDSMQSVDRDVAGERLVLAATRDVHEAVKAALLGKNEELGQMHLSQAQGRLAELRRKVDVWLLEAQVVSI